MHMAAAVALLWLQYPLLILAKKALLSHMGREATVVISDMADVLLMHHRSSAIQWLQYKTQSAQPCISKQTHTTLHAGCATILIITTKAEPWLQPESARAAAKGVLSHDCSYNHSYIRSQSVHAAVTLTPLWRTGLTSSS